MRVNISHNGFLMIDRGTKGDPQWKTMTCPFTADSDGEARGYCGDWCPHFGDVEFTAMAGCNRQIELCHGKKIGFESNYFVDNRP